MWNESIALAFPKKFEDVPIEELWVHVLLWDYDSLSTDDLVAHAAFPLSEIRAGQMQEVAAHNLHPLPGSDSDLSKSRLWVAFDPCMPQSE